MPAGDRFQIPSTQWFVGLADGNDSMLVAVWEAILPGRLPRPDWQWTGRLIDSLNIAPGTNAFCLSIGRAP